MLSGSWLCLLGFGGGFAGYFGCLLLCFLLYSLRLVWCTRVWSVWMLMWLYLLVFSWIGLRFWMLFLGWWFVIVDWLFFGLRCVWLIAGVLRVWVCLYSLWLLIWRFWLRLIGWCRLGVGFGCVSCTYGTRFVAYTCLDWGLLCVLLGCG